MESTPLQKFSTAFEAETKAENKLRLCLEFMRATLSHEKGPIFRDFWQTQRLCLPLFKENLTAPIRSELWAEYMQLGQEVRRLKELVTEQASFAEEQIALALKSVEEEIHSIEEKLLQIARVDLPETSQFLNPQLDFFKNTQQRAQLFNGWTARLHELRREILKSPLRARVKQQLLERISPSIQQVSDERKSLIENLSNHFKETVDSFIETYFGSKRTKAPFYMLKEEIRFLQQAAKLLSINSVAFQGTREKLSHCWDTIKAKEEEYKKQRKEKETAPSVSQKKPVEKLAPPSEEPILALQEEIHHFQIQAPTLPKEELLAQTERLAKRIKETTHITEIDALLLRTRLDEAADCLFEEDKAGLEPKIKQVRDALEQHRKKVGGSALSFAEAMLYQELIESEKMRLERLESLATD